MINDWAFKGSLAWHTPCNSPAYAGWFDRYIICNQCKEPLPEELELPAQVFKSYNELQPIVFDADSSFYITTMPHNIPKSITYTISSRPNSIPGSPKVK